jgi:hypothetical protein
MYPYFITKNMDTNIDQLILMLGVSALTRLGLCLMSQRKKETLVRKKRERAGYVCAVCMPKKAGKTRLCSKLQGSGGRVPSLLVDMGEILKEEMNGVVANEQNRKVMYYPKAKSYVEGLKRDFPKHRIILFTDDYELISYLEIVDTVCYAPRLAVHSTLVNQIQDAEKRREVELSYVKTIASDTRPIFYYESLEAVVEQMRQRYGLSLTI